MPTAMETPSGTTSAESTQERLERLLAEQGVTSTANAEQLAKTGEGLWDSDQEFDDFLEILRGLRREVEPKR